LLDRLRRNWRLACGDAPEPSAAVIDSRSCRSPPSCFDRGIDGGKKIRGVKIHVAVDKYGMPPEFPNKSPGGSPGWRIFG
jgi:hypothetical protein